MQNKQIVSTFALLLLPAIASGQDVANRVSDTTLSLTVRDCLILMLENNGSITVEEYGPDIVGTFIAREESIFDPAVQADYNTSESRGQRTSGVSGFREVESQNKDASLSIRKKFPVGVEVDAGLEFERRSSNVFRKLYSTRLGATLTMPVLEGYGTQVNLVGIRQAETDVEISRYELRGFVNALAAEVEETYWNIQLAREELKIQNASLHLAQQQFSETKDRIDVGALGEIELAAAEGEVAMRESTVIDAQSSLQKTKLYLLQALNPQVDNPWSLEVELLNPPEMDHPEKLGSVEQRLGVALEKRPDLRQAQLEIEKSGVALVRTRNGLLPRLDFFLTLGRTGYARSFDETFTTSARDDNFDAAGGFLFQIPLRNRVDRSRHKRAVLSQERAQSALANFTHLVELDVRIAFLEVERSTRQIDMTERASKLQEAAYQAELEKFKVGKSTSLLVLIAQRDLVQARLNEVRAQIEERKALADLHFAEGTTLDRHGLVLPTR